MKLKEFIKKLKSIEREYGESIEVVMADNIPVVNPIFSDKYYKKGKVIITDKE